jgi:hypothetical protein
MPGSEQLYLHAAAIRGQAGRLLTVADGLDRAAAPLPDLLDPTRARITDDVWRGRSADRCVDQLKWRRMELTAAAEQLRTVARLLRDRAARLADQAAAAERRAEAVEAAEQAALAAVRP